MSLAAVPNLESELDGLYALPLAQFTKARNDLAARLRKAHQDDVAAAVRALKKPSTVAWVANSLAREQPKQVDALLQAAEQLRDAQQRSLGGKASAEEVGEASAAEREALRGLLTSARTALGARATATAARAAVADLARGRDRRERARAPATRPADRGAEGGRLRTARGSDTVPPPG